MVHRVTASLSKAFSRLGFAQEWWLVILAAILGTLTGFGAVGFSRSLKLLELFIHNQHARVGWWGLILFPTVGMLFTGLLIINFASEAKGHGVPQVMRALISRGGVIKGRIGIVKVVASVLCVGSGCSAGTEGPIVQIGAVIGSVGGQWLKVSREHMQTLVGCGAAAGISSVFNAPIAGVFFVLEIILRDFSLKTFTPIIVASVFSAVATQSMLGDNEAIFTAERTAVHSYSFSPVELPSYILLGALCGLVAVWFNRLLHLGEDLYEKWKVPELVKPITGGLAMGVLGIAYVAAEKYVFPSLLEHRGEGPQVPFFGNGYATIHVLLDPTSYPHQGGAGVMMGLALLLIVLVAVKGVATTFTLASGGSGGIFAPSLFLGATTGAALGQLLESLSLIPSGSTPASYALVGMAAVVAGATHAPLTAILILFELTRNIYVVLPIMLAAVVSTAVAQLIDRDSIYTFKLRRSGLKIGGARDLTVMRRFTTASCEISPLPPDPIYASDPLSKLIALHAYHNIPDFVVVEQETGKYIGMVTSTDIRTALIDREAIPLLLVAEVMRTDLPTVRRDETLDTILDKFSRYDVASLAVVSPIDTTLPMAILTRNKALQRYRQALEES
ncbi:MAG: chloride channel protein [Phycisphaerales bacterium]|nr:chloride channel protein [Phycisphaerales bacterium]